MNLVVSEAVMDLYGVPKTAQDKFDPLGATIHAEDRPVLISAFGKLRSIGEPLSVRYRLTRADDGAERWLDARGVAIRAANGVVQSLEGTIADVTELVRAKIEAQTAHAELSQAHNFQRAVISATPDAIHIYDVRSTTLLRANRSGGPFVGFTDASVRVMGGSIEDLVPAEDVHGLEQAFEAACRAGQDPVRIRHRVREPDGDMRWLSRRMTPFERDSSDAVTQILVVSRDVTDVVAMEQQLAHAALHDELTGLPNRRLIQDRLEQSLRRSSRGGHTAVLLCDLDGFKRINDSRGHLAGDKVLKEAAQRISRATREGDTAGRLGGDEFVVVLEIPQHHDPVASAEDVARRLTASVAETMNIDGAECSVTTSVGIRIADDAATAESMLSDADAAMYFIKTHGAAGHALFQPSQRPDTTTHERIHETIRQALAQQSIAAHYQPIVNPYTHALVAVEALARIPGEDGQFLNAGQAISVAEQTGLITALDEEILRIACRQAAAWRHRNHPDLMLKVNRSVAEITRPGFYKRICDALGQSGLAPHALTLEITETVLLDASEENLGDLRRLHALGVGLAIDDFGTGYASLRYLAELPITCIKIDKSFTSGLPDNTTAMTLVRATIGLAQQLDIDCVVEGVESTAQLLALPRYDRLRIQGYLYARPQPPHLRLPTHFRPTENVATPADGEHRSAVA